MAQPQLDAALHLFEVQADIALKYGIDVGARTIQLVGEIHDMTFCHIDTALTLMESQSKAKVTIKINSNGGSVYNALAIVGRMQASKCKIVTEVYGACMSAATMILAAGETRRMSKLAYIMHHEMSYEVAGTHSQNKHNVLQAEREGETWAITMEALTGTPKDVWREKGKAGIDWYLSSAEAKNMGIVDELF